MTLLTVRCVILGLFVATTAICALHSLYFLHTPPAGFIVSLIAFSTFVDAQVCAL
jgi:hypothetical protein